MDRFLPFFYQLILFPIENVEADVETYDEYYDEDANMDNTGEDSKGRSP